MAQKGAVRAAVWVEVRAIQINSAWHTAQHESATKEEGMATVPFVGLCLKRNQLASLA